MAAAVADQYLALLSPVGHMKSPVEVSLAQKVYQWTQEIYTEAGAPNHFRILGRNPELHPADRYLTLLDTSPSAS